MKTYLRKKSKGKSKVLSKEEVENNRSATDIRAEYIEAMGKAGINAKKASEALKIVLKGFIPFAKAMRKQQNKQSNVDKAIQIIQNPENRRMFKRLKLIEL